MKPDSIPVFTELFTVEGVRLPDAAVFGAVWFYSYQDEKYCTKAPATLAKELGLGVNTVRRSIAKLIELKLIKDTTPEVRNTTHKLRLTEMGRQLLPERLPKMGNQERVTNKTEVTQNEQPRVPKMGNQTAKRLPKMGIEKKENKNLNKNTTTDVVDSGTSHSNKSTLFPETESERLLFKLINAERRKKQWTDIEKFPTYACKEKFGKAAEALNGQTGAMIVKANEQGFIAIVKVVNYVAGCAKNIGKYTQNGHKPGPTKGRQNSQDAGSGGNAAGVSEAFAAIRARGSERVK